MMAATIARITPTTTTSIRVNARRTRFISTSGGSRPVERVGKEEAGELKGAVRREPQQAGRAADGTIDDEVELLDVIERQGVDVHFDGTGDARSAGRAVQHGVVDPAHRRQNSFAVHDG